MKNQMYPCKFLAIDDGPFLEVENLQRKVNAAMKHPEPVLRLDAPWNGPGDLFGYMNTIYDEDEGIFKMWYCVHEAVPPCGGKGLAYATSTDGINWDRPELGIVEINGSKKNNYILPGISITPSIIKDSSDIPERRYKMIFTVQDLAMVWAQFHSPLNFAYSADGIHWQPPVHVNPILRGISDDCFSIMYDPDRRKYLLFTRRVPNLPRDISLYESYDLVNWEDRGRILIGGDKHDPPEVYNFYYMAPFRYEKFFLSMLCCQYTSAISETYDSYNRSPDFPDTTTGHLELQLAYSNDGRSWQRPADRTPIVHWGERGSFDEGLVYPAQNPIVKDGETWIYYKASRNIHSHWYVDEQRARNPNGPHTAHGMLARMPEDHWVSLEAGAEEGQALTKPMAFAEWEDFLVNADAAGGSIEAELLTPFGQVVEGYSRGDCIPVTSDGKDQILTWKGSGKMADLLSQHRGGLCIRLYLKNAKLYSYTITEPDPEDKKAQYWANHRWGEIIKHRSDNWERLSTDPAGGLPPHGGPGPEKGQEKPGQIVLDF